MAPRERLALRHGKPGKAQLEVAAHDQAPLAAQSVREAAERAAHGKRLAVRQKTNQAQTAEAEPQRPVCGLPVAVEAAAFLSHGVELQDLSMRRGSGL